MNTFLSVLLATALSTQAAPVEVIGEVRVHGNHTTPDADILALAGLTVGGPASDAVLTQAADKLRDSGRFADIDLRKRFRSIDNPADILVILLVDEHAAVSNIDLTPGALKRFRSAGMWLPVVDFADGYGFTYGARVSFVDVLGPRSRISMPLTWGGEGRAGVEIERAFRSGPVSRLHGSVSLARRENPHFEIADSRREASVRAERTVTSWLRVGGGARISDVTFGETRQRHLAPGVDVIVDTRTDPGFPRNAVHLTGGAEQLRFAGGENIRRLSADARGYLGLVGASVVALRATSIRANHSLPPYEQALLGGSAILRGYEFGYRAGDNLAALSAELRIPVTSPVSVGRFGVKAFIDAGTVYAAALKDQTFDRGVGGGIFLTATVLHANLDVAWPQTGERKPRWHFGLGLSF
ncbi:MAG TPA: BamA/TamA family outer membrane protein [Vicinamibacterales bacterium]|nr:BamA/TamA family outer membrane protein [Vicinamibacterales bacterium]